MNHSILTRLTLLTVCLAAAGTTRAQSLEDVMKATRSLTSYQATMNLPGGKSVISYTKLKDGKPAKMKSETDDGGWNIVDLETKEMFTKMPDQEAIFKMSAPADQAVQEPAGDVNAMSDANTKVTEGELEGTAVWIVEQTLEDKSTSKSWLDKKNGLPLKVETKGKVLTYTYDQINEVPDSVFTLPEGVPVQDMSSMLDPNNLPQIQN